MTCRWQWRTPPEEPTAASVVLVCGVPTSLPPTQLAALMEPYARHVLVCTGGYCSPNREGRMLYAQLARLLEREALLFGPRRVKRGETPCLGVCAGGPIVVVYPEGIWYAGVTPELLERIVVEHLRDGRVVEEAVFHRLG
jgi:(2Fe-2S) ferredoxin